MTDAVVPKAKRRRREPPPTTPDAIEIAMEAEASGLEPASAARQVLVGQLGLIETQTRHLLLCTMTTLTAFGEHGQHVDKTHCQRGMQ